MPVQFAPEAIERWPIDRLRPYARNAKTHAPDQVAKIAASMAEFGWTVPVLVSAEGEVIAGHGRILAAGELGLPEVPVIILDHLSEAQRRAYRIADNKLTELGGWDDALLAQELHALNGDGFDLSLTGLDEAELDRLMGELRDEAEGAAGEDEVPEPPVDPITRPGDLWVLGRHRPALRRCHGRGRCRTAALGCYAAPHGHRSAVRGELRSFLEEGGWRFDHQPHRQGGQ